MKLELKERDITEYDFYYAFGNDEDQISLFVDSKTGVEYFIAGRDGRISAICPRLKEDGKPFVRK